MKPTSNQLHPHLQSLAKQQESLLGNEVAKILLSCELSDLKAYISDILKHGCVSGIVSELIYYSDTHEFYDRHYFEIEALRAAYEEIHGIQLTVQGDLKNAYAWFAFEWIVTEIVNDVGLEI